MWEMEISYKVPSARGSQMFTFLNILNTELAV